MTEPTPKERENLLRLTNMTWEEVREAVAVLQAAGVEPVEGCYGIRTRKGGVLTVRVADL
jgi:hypothetical protein